MAFILESCLDGAPPVVETALMTNSEAGAVGELMVFSSGRLTKCAATTKPQVVLVKATAAGTDVSTDYIRIRRDHVFKADTTGTDPVVGVAAHQVDSTGLLVNGAEAASGYCIIRSMNAAANVARVTFDL